MDKETITDCVYVSNRLGDSLNTPKLELTIWQWVCKLFFGFNDGKDIK